MVVIFPYIVKDIQRFVCTTTNNCKSLPLTILEYYDLTFVVKGRLTYIIDGKTIVLNKNDAMLLRPGTSRKRITDDSFVSYVSFNFFVFDDLNVSFDFAFLPNIITHEISDILLAYPGITLTQQPYEKEKLINLLNYILLTILQSRDYATYNPYVVEAIDYIEKNIYTSISLQEVSRHLSISKEYLAKLFKDGTGVSLLNFILDKKVNLAKQLIKSNEYSLIEISNTLGFNNYNYFSRIFKNKCGISPNKYRKRKLKR